MDGIAYLIAEGAESFDADGNRVVEQTGRMVYCQIYGVTRSEFYQAATVDLQPEITLRLSDFAEYAGEKLVEFEGTLYSVIRTYRDTGSFHRGQGAGMAPNEIELILERKIGDGTEIQS